MTNEDISSHIYVLCELFIRTPCNHNEGNLSVVGPNLMLSQGNFHFHWLEICGTCDKEEVRDHIWEL
jgi:hypothetical protein